jgi:nicotinate-nucleotide adenylyltransferase
MVELACRSNPRFIPSPLEVNAGEKSYSIITLNKVKRLYPRAHLFFILGIDAFLEIETWRDYQRLLRECLFIVMARPGYSLADARGVLEGRIAPRIHEVKDGEKVGGGPFGGRRIFLLPIKALDVSSTEVRRRIKAGESLKGLVSETVAIYLKKHKLYE